MSFITSALGAQNGFQVQSGGGSNSPAAVNTSQQQEQQIFGQQGTFAQQLLAQSQGQGPNIADLQLQQATNQNNQRAAGALASQRGMNPALAQRIIAQQAATNNQNAAGQSGILRAQQQLAAQNQLGNVYGQQAGEAATNIGTYVGAQQAANQANAQIAQNNSNLNAQTASGILNPASTLSLAKGGQVKPSAEHHLEQLLIAIGSKVKPKHLAAGGGFGTKGDVAIFAPLATGGAGAGGAANLNPKMFQTGTTDPTTGMDSVTGYADDLSGVGGTAAGGADFAGADLGASAAGAADLGAAAGAAEGGGDILGLAALAAHGGKIPAMVSPGERFIPPHLVEAVRKGKVLASHISPKFPGKAKIKGDNEENDTVPKMLSPGGVVIPRTKADNDNDAREFLLAIKADKDKKNGPSGYAKILAMKRKNA